jgi:hypothetical protein
MGSAGERVGVMIIRVWTEDSDRALRARLTRTLDLSTSDERSEAMAGSEAVLSAVGRFIQEFLRAGADADADGHANANADANANANGA